MTTAADVSFDDTLAKLGVKTVQAAILTLVAQNASLKQANKNLMSRTAALEKAQKNAAAALGGLAFDDANNSQHQPGI